MQTKLFIIGLNKAGTRSLHRLFKDSGYKSVHWHEGKLAKSIEDNVMAGIDPIQEYKRFDVFSDMEGIYGQPVTESYRYFRQIYFANPDAIFLLNYRDVDDWLRSKMSHGIKNHGYNIYLQYYKDHLNAKNDQEVLDHWRRTYYQHHSDVLNFFSDKPGSLILFNLDRDSLVDLAERVKPHFTLIPDRFPHVGKTKE